jgi:hypothetical protein
MEYGYIRSYNDETILIINPIKVNPVKAGDAKLKGLSGC